MFNPRCVLGLPIPQSSVAIKALHLYKSLTNLNLLALRDICFPMVVSGENCDTSQENEAENLYVESPDQSSQYSRILHQPVQQVVVSRQAATP